MMLIRFPYQIVNLPRLSMCLVTNIYQKVLAVSDSSSSAPWDCNHLKETVVILFLKRVSYVYYERNNIINMYLAVTDSGTSFIFVCWFLKPLSTDTVIFLPFCHGFIRPHYHLLITMVKLVTVSQ